MHNTKKTKAIVLLILCSVLGFSFYYHNSHENICIRYLESFNFEVQNLFGSIKYTDSESQIPISGKYLLASGSDTWESIMFQNVLDSQAFLLSPESIYEVYMFDLTNCVFGDNLRANVLITTSGDVVCASLTWIGSLTPSELTKLGYTGNPKIFSLSMDSPRSYYPITTSPAEIESSIIQTYLSSLST